VPRALGNATRAATGAEATLLAGKRQQPFGMALLAHHAQKAVLEHAAAQERLELLAHGLEQILLTAGMAGVRVGLVVHNRQG